MEGGRKEVKLSQLKLWGRSSCKVQAVVNSVSENKGGTKLPGCFFVGGGGGHKLEPR